MGRILILLLLGQLAPQAPLALPKEAKDVVGIYQRRPGLEILTIELLTGGELKMETRHDHPGKTTWTGKWRFENEAIHVEINYTRGGKAEVSKDVWVPIVWGDRLILADQAELKAGRVGQVWKQEAESLNKHGKRHSSEEMNTQMVTRVKQTSGPLPKRYGRVVAPKEFKARFDGIDLKLPR